MWKALIKLVEKWACCHNWEVVDSKSYEHLHTLAVEQNEYRNILLKCTKCGKLKTKRL